MPVQVQPAANTEVQPRGISDPGFVAGIPVAEKNFAGTTLVPKTRQEKTKHNR
jgi:hypothetical protein